ncbi:hypothetical protein GWI33_014139 [Rhynchophorus ferrugineus]|uniref:Uncharacterized protein n=1 Tax=Rhynchophorus ferrugineus TaxID=354439 RepID=A0A834I811_RHYFE|nr:hypothetical protein GWI33_014139 [Rhynchophorus ferrugineus]
MGIKKSDIRAIEMKQCLCVTANVHGGMLQTSLTIGAIACPADAGGGVTATPISLSTDVKVEPAAWLSAEPSAIPSLAHTQKCK